MELSVLVILIGFKGCGKTSVGRRLAAKSGADFIDLDDLIETAYAADHEPRLTCRQIYRTLGEDGFRQLESTTLRDLKYKGQAILAIGGGTLAGPENVAVLHELGTMLYLHAAPDDLYERIMHDGLPAYFDANDPRRSFDDYYAQRITAYEQAADIVIDTTGLDIEQCAARAYEALGFDAQTAKESDTDSSIG
jgi:shikimate kinase